jgi:hypothetical protein
MKRIKLCDYHSFIKDTVKKHDKLLAYIKHELFKLAVRVIGGYLNDVVCIYKDGSFTFELLVTNGVHIVHMPLEPEGLYYIMATNRSSYFASFFKDGTKKTCVDDGALQQITSDIATRLLKTNWTLKMTNTLKLWSNTTLEYWEDRYNYMLFVWKFSRVFDRCVRKYLWKYFKGL